MRKKLSTGCLVLFLSAIIALLCNAQSQELIDCFEEQSLHYTNGKYQDTEIKYRLRVPTTIRRGQKYPLVIHLHGLYESGSDNVRSLFFLDSILPLLAGPNQRDFFMLVPQSPSETPHWHFQRSTKDGTLDVLIALLEHVVATNPIDTSRITVTGICGHGGRGVWELIMQYPDMFAGAVLTESNAPTPSPRLAALTQTPIWSIIYKGDEHFFESNHAAISVINHAGGSMALTKTDEPGDKVHVWILAMEDYKSIQWLLAQKQGSWFAPPPGVAAHSNNPRSLLLASVMYVVPFAIVVFLLWGKLCTWTLMAYQHVRPWSSRL